MATKNITQLRRLVLRKTTDAGTTWSTVTIDQDNLGQDTVMTVNVAPRLMSRSSSVATTETPIEGTFDSLSGSITFIPDVWRVLGQALDRWNAATWAGADTNDGNIIYGDPTNLCGDGAYYSVIAQGVCDDGSAADVELTRCFPSIDDDIEIGTTDAVEVTLNLHPIAYNATLHASDGYPAYTARFGVESTTKKTRLNAATGVYDDVSE